MSFYRKIIMIMVMIMIYFLFDATKHRDDFTIVFYFLFCIKSSSAKSSRLSGLRWYKSLVAFKLVNELQTYVSGLCEFQRFYYYRSASNLCITASCMSIDQSQGMLSASVRRAEL